MLKTHSHEVSLSLNRKFQMVPTSSADVCVRECVPVCTQEGPRESTRLGGGVCVCVCVCVCVLHRLFSRATRQVLDVNGSTVDPKGREGKEPSVLCRV